MAGIEMVHVPFNGAGPAMNAVLAGDVQVFFAQSAAALPQLKGGRVFALGVASPKRIERHPELPTIAESGLPGFDVTSWYALVAPSGTPADRVDRIQSTLARAFARAGRAREDRGPRRRAGCEHAGGVQPDAGDRGGALAHARTRGEHPCRLTSRASPAVRVAI
jgi:hypothetical protein